MKINLPNGQVANFPDDMPPAEIEAVLARQFPPEQQQEPEPEKGFGGIGMGGSPLSALLHHYGPTDLAESAMNMPRSMYWTGRGLYEGVKGLITDPVGTGTALGKAAAGGVETASKASGLHQLLSGVEAGEPSQNMQMFNVMADRLDKRYGSVKAFKNTIEQDPAGFMMDLSGLASLAGAKSLAKLADPVNVATNTIRAGIHRVMPPGYPASLIETALKLPPKMDDAVRVRIVNTILDKGLAPTVRGLTKTQELITSFDDLVKNSAEIATKNGYRIPTRELLRNLNKLEAKYSAAVTPDAAKQLKVVQGMVKDFKKTIKKHGDYILPRKLLEEKRATYGNINWGKTGRKGTVRNQVNEAVSADMRWQLERLDPSVKGANAELGALIDTKQPLGQAVHRMRNANQFGVDFAAKVSTGALVDISTGTPGVGSVMGFTAAALGHPKVKSALAIKLHNLQKLAESGEAIQRSGLPPVLIRQFLFQTGQIEDAIMNEELKAERKTKRPQQ